MLLRDGMNDAGTASRLNKGAVWENQVDRDEQLGLDTVFGNLSWRALQELHFTR